MIPFVVPYIICCRIIIGIQTGSIILTTTHVCLYFPFCFGVLGGVVLVFFFIFVLLVFWRGDGGYL